MDKRNKPIPTEKPPRILLAAALLSCVFLSSGISLAQSPDVPHEEI